MTINTNKRKQTFHFLKHLEHIQWFCLQYQKNQVALHSANMVFSLLLSFFPFVLLLFYFMKYTSYTEKDVLNIISLIVPGKNLVETLSSWVSEGYKNALQNFYLSGSIIGIAWSASRGFRDISICLNRIYNVKVKRSFFAKIGLAISYTFALAVLLLLTLFVFIHGNQLIALLQRVFPHEPTMIESSLFRLLIEVGICFFFFLLIYWAIPNKKLSFKKQIPGATVAAVLWLIFCYGFAFFVDNLKDYSSIYGSMGYIIVCSLWLYICMQIFFIGAIVNQYFHLRRTGQCRSKCPNKNILKFLRWIFQLGQAH